MSGCIDEKLGQLLHDYELGLLSDEDSHRFELHLYDCEYCLGQVREFMDVSKILMGDPDSRTLMERLADEAEHQADKKKSSPFLKLLIAAIFIVIIAVPIYRYGIHREPSGIVQTLELLPSRAGGSDIIYLEKGGDVSISFFADDGFEGPADVSIANLTGDTVFSSQNFTDFNAQGFGTITLPVSDFSEGHYTLQVIPADAVAAPERLYMFRVKQD